MRKKSTHVLNILFVGLFSLLATGAVKAQTMVKVAADTHIHSYSGNVDNNFGASTNLIVKTKADGSSDRLGLVKNRFYRIK